MHRMDYTNTAIAAYLNSGGGDPDDIRATLVDLFADLMHACHDHGIDHHEVLLRATSHYNAERAERIGLPRD